MEEKRRIDYGDRRIIENMLEESALLVTIAEEVMLDPTSVSREIKRNRMHLGDVARSRFKIITCANFENCKIGGICNPKCKRRCRSCDTNRCDKLCPSFVEFSCTATKRYPHVCNGCKNLNRCPKERMVYRAKPANKKSLARASESRRGLDLDKEQREKIAQIVVPLLAKGHSVKEIRASHPEIGLSPTALYRYIDAGVLGTAKNIDLPRKVRFKKRKLNRDPAEPARDLEGRDYKAFKALPQAVQDTTKEFDTVIGRPGGKCLLTFIMRENEIFYAVLLDKKTAQCAEDAFDELEMLAIDAMVLGELGALIFLTDRGTEFYHYDLLERSCYTPGIKEKRLSVYYCNPYHSWEKPAIENAHTLLRRILPKGVSFDDLTQEQINLVCSHINSYPREELKWKSPFEMLPEWGQEYLPEAFGMCIIPRDEVNLKPSLLGR